MKYIPENRKEELELEISHALKCVCQTSCSEESLNASASAYATIQKCSSELRQIENAEKWAKLSPESREVLLKCKEVNIAIMSGK